MMNIVQNEIVWFLLYCVWSRKAADDARLTRWREVYLKAENNLAMAFSCKRSSRPIYAVMVRSDTLLHQRIATKYRFNLGAEETALSSNGGYEKPFMVDSLGSTNVISSWRWHGSDHRE